MTKPPVISPAYAEMNRQLHEDKPEYGVGAAFDAPTILALCRQNGFASVLDFGCGKGALKQALATSAPDITVLEFDPAVPGKDSLPTQPFDLLVALDVMEHIEPDYLTGALATMRDLAPKGVVLKIALIPANKTLPDGRNAHLIVESKVWWQEQLAPFFKTVGVQDIPSHFIFMGTPKQD